MADYTRVDWEMLRAAKAKCRQITREAETRKDHQSMVHTAYKLGAFLTEALPDAWPAADVRAPDVVEEGNDGR